MQGSSTSGFSGWYIFAGALLSAVISASLAYHFTRRSSLRSNAERWLDAVRDDLSEFVALHWLLCSLQVKGLHSILILAECQEASREASAEPAELLRQIHGPPSIRSNARLSLNVAFAFSTARRSAATAGIKPGGAW
jgi:hypothetical protein